MSTKSSFQYDIDPSGIQVIDLDMMDPKKFYPLSVLSGVSVRAILYPHTLIRTRLQIQNHRDLYSGVIDAFKKIYFRGGVKGLYEGFLFNNFGVLSQLTYVSSYEHMRRAFLNNFADTHGPWGKYMAGLCGGFCASVCAQVFQVPIDIVNQHLQMQGATQASTYPAATKRAFGEAPLNVIRRVYALNGIRSFYKGFFVSTAFFAPSSALWWGAYAVYQGKHLFLVQNSVL